METGEKENKTESKVQIIIPNILQAELDRAATLNGVTKSEKAAELISWALEEIDPATGKLPDKHPTTGRSIEEIKEHPMQTFRGVKKPSP